MLRTVLIEKIKDLHIEDGAVEFVKHICGLYSELKEQHHLHRFDKVRVYEVRFHSEQMYRYTSLIYGINHVFTLLNDYEIENHLDHIKKSFAAFLEHGEEEQVTDFELYLLSQIILAYGEAIDLTRYQNRYHEGKYGSFVLDHGEVQASNGETYIVKYIEVRNRDNTYRGLTCKTTAIVQFEVFYLMAEQRLGKDKNWVDNLPEEIRSDTMRGITGSYPF